MIVSKEYALSLKQEQPTHFNYIDKTDTRFGMLNSRHYAGRDSRGKHQFACECDCGNWCLVTSVNLNENVVGCGCLKDIKWKQAAADKRRIDVDETEKWIIENTKYLPICTNEAATRARWSLYCKDHGVFTAQLGLLKQDRVGCPQCRPGKGFKSRFKGSLYVHKVYKDGSPICLKFGITNTKVSSRKNIIEAMSNYSVNLETIFIYEDKDGAFIRNLESRIKKEFTTKVVSKDILPDGYTETVSLEDENKIILWLDNATSIYKGDNKYGNY